MDFCFFFGKIDNLKKFATFIKKNNPGRLWNLSGGGLNFLSLGFIQYIEQSFEILGKLAFKGHSLTRRRVGKCQTLCVQHLTVKQGGV